MVGEVSDMYVSATAVVVFSGQQWCTAVAIMCDVFIRDHYLIDSVSSICYGKRLSHASIVHPLTVKLRMAH